MASFASSATTCGARKHAWTKKKKFLIKKKDIPSRYAKIWASGVSPKVGEKQKT